MSKWQARIIAAGVALAILAGLIVLGRVLLDAHDAHVRADAKSEQKISDQQEKIDQLERDKQDLKSEITAVERATAEAAQPYREAARKKPSAPEIAQAAVDLGAVKTVPTVSQAEDGEPGVVFNRAQSLQLNAFLNTCRADQVDLGGCKTELALQRQVTEKAEQQKELTKSQRDEALKMRKPNWFQRHWKALAIAGAAAGAYGSYRATRR